MAHRLRTPALALLLALVLGACGGAAEGANTSVNHLTQTGNLLVEPQNTDLVLGVNRLSLALLDTAKKPIVDATDVTVVIEDHAGATVAQRPLQYIGHGYGQIPVYVGVARFAATGQYKLVVQGRSSSGAALTGIAFVPVTGKSTELPVGHSLREVKAALRQQLATDPGVKLTDIDSGVPADDFHDVTIEDGLDRHMPMVLYFGEPGRCPSQTCGPTVQILQQVFPDYRNRVLFEHLELHIPAQSETFNPLYAAFGLTSEPWVYLVNAQGVVTDRFEGFLTPAELRGAIDGTLAGKVPAVDLGTG